MDSPETSIVKVDAAKRQVFGWAYVAKTTDGAVVVDRQGDFIDEDDVLEKMAYDFVIDARSGDVMHNDVKVATLIESMAFTPEKIEKMGLPAGSLPTAWWVGMQIEKGHYGDLAWEHVQKGNLGMWSIGGKGIRETVDMSKEALRKRFISSTGKVSA